MIATTLNSKECELLPHNSDLYFLGSGGSKKLTFLRGGI